MSVVGTTPFSVACLVLRSLSFRDADRLAGEIFDQVGPGLGAVLAAANDADDVVDPVQRNLIALQDVLALARFHQQVSGAPPHHVDAVIDEVLDGLHQAHLFRLAVDHGQEDHAEAFLHRGVLEELVEHDLRLATALQLDDDAHAIAIALVAHVADLVDHLVVHQFGNMFDQLRLVDLVRNLGDDDRVLVLREVLDRSLGAHHEAAAPGAIGLGDAAAAVNESAGRESPAPARYFSMSASVACGLFTSVMQASTISVRLCGGMLVAMPTAMPFEPFTSRFGNSGRQHHRLDRGVVEVGDEVDRVFVDVGQQLFRNFGQARFGIPVGRGRIAIDRAKVALAIDQRIAQAPRLRQTHHRVVNRAVAMRMILLQTLADDAGALHVLAVVQHAHVVHGVENAAMHRLQSVAHVGQRAPDDDRHRIVEIRTPHLVFNVDGLHVGGAGADVVEW